MPCYCIILNCQTPSRAKGRSYCRIPAIITNQGEETQRLSEERRRLWLAAINRGELTENTLQHARVCGAHFVSGKAAPLWNRTTVDWVPTLNLRLQTISVDEERAQERAWRQFTKRRRIREAGHEMIGAHSSKGKRSSGVQAGGDTTAPITSKRARVSDSLQRGGEDLHGASDHVSEEDSTPMVGTLGFSKETTLALLNRMFTEELLSELNRRSIVVKPAGGDRPRGRSDLEHVLREVMTREYEEAEGNSGTSMDTSNTSSTFEHSRSDASSSFEHSSRLDEETSGSEVFSGPNNEQAPTDNIQEPTMMIQQTSTSRQAADMNISEAPSTSSAYPVEVLVKKEPVEDVEYCVATSSSSSNIVASTTEPSTSQMEHPGIGDGSQGRLARNLSQAKRIKTESEVEEGKEDVEQEDLSSEHCPSSPGQLSQELDKVEVSTEDEGDAKPSTSTEEPVKDMKAGCSVGKMFPCLGIDYEQYKKISTNLYYFPSNARHDMSTGHHTVFSKHCVKWFKVAANSTPLEKAGKVRCWKCKEFIRGVKQSDKRNAMLSKEEWQRRSKLYVKRVEQQVRNKKDTGTP